MGGTPAGTRRRGKMRTRAGGPFVLSQAAALLGAALLGAALAGAGVAAKSPQGAQRVRTADPKTAMRRSPAA